MKITDIYNNRIGLSFEIFPPKEEKDIEKSKELIDKLSLYNPDYISVTYGALGTTKGNTLEIAKYIKNQKSLEVLPHLTCINAAKEETEQFIKELRNYNIDNVLALRGDFPQGVDKTNGEYKYASDLTSHIREKSDICIGGAFYPEGHIENNDLMDIFNLKKKVDCGAEFLISQMFFDNKVFYKFKENAEKINIKIPLIAGIIPVTNKNQITKILSMANATLTPKFKRILEKYEHNPLALKEAGTAYAIEQIIDLFTYGVDGIHLYTLNKVNTTKTIVESVSNIRKANFEMIELCN